MRGLRTCALALAVGALAAGCGGPAEKKSDDPAALAQGAPAQAGPDAGPPVRGDWLVMHFLADPENLNPLTSNDAGASAILSWIFPSLIRVDPQTLELAPSIAKALPVISPDHLSYEYTLRDDVTFSDGTPLTAEDVVFALKASRHPKVNAPHVRNYLESVADAIALERLTVRIRISKAYFMNDWVLGGIQPLPRHYYDPENLLGDIDFKELAGDYDALPPEKKERADRFAKDFNEKFNRNPMGPGAVALENPGRDFVTGEKVELRRRPDSWAAGHPELGDPYVDRVVYRVINDFDAALAALKGGDIDFMGLRPVQYLKQTNDARFNERNVKHEDLAGSFTYIGWNERRWIFRDKLVRQALSYLVDKKNICEKVMLGLADPVESPIYPKRPEFDKNLKPWPFDPAKAKKLLAEAGWTDTDGDGVLDHELEGKRVPLRFEILSNSGNEDRKNLGLVVIDEFKRAGIDASFRAVDWSILLEKVKSFEYDAVILGWTSSGSSPPDLYQIWHSSMAVAGGSNHISFMDEEVDRLLTEYRGEFDAAKRKVIIDRIQEILYDLQPYTFVYAPKSLSAYDRRFRNVIFYPTGGAVEAEWWVPKQEQKYH